MSHFTGDDVATFIVPEAAIQFNQYGWIDEVYLCDYMATYGEIASGTSDYTGHDNDLRAGVNEHNRTNSFGAKAHGVLFTPSDDPVMFNGGFHCLYAYNPKKDELRFECKDRINLGD
jgi:hypothetical protein